MTAALCISLLILAAPPQGSIAAPVGRIGNPSYDAGERIIFRSAFDVGGDLNADRWPDGWRRRVGPGFPAYVTMSLAADATAPGGHCLRVRLNGGAAAAHSPVVEVSPQRAYTVTAWIKTEGLQHDCACLTWRLLDADQKPIAEYASAKVGGDNPWRELTLPRQVSDDSRVRFAAVGLYVQPDDPADLAGSVSLAGLRVVSEPRLRVTTNQPRNIFGTDQQVTIKCQVTGLATERGGPVRLSMELIDVAEPVAAGPRDGAQRAVTNVWDLSPSTDNTSHVNTLTWSPRLPGVGCYRLRTRLTVGRIVNPSAADASSPDDQRPPIAEHETALAVLPPPGRIAHGTFGWSLPLTNGSPLPPQLAELADRLGVGTIKLPLWPDEKDELRRAALCTLIENLRSRDVRVVGVLANPAAEIRKALFDDPAADGSIASLLTVPKAKLRPQLETAIMPWVLQVHDWQLGADTDQSLRGSPQAAEQLRELGQELAQRGLPVRLALSKALVSDPPTVDKPPTVGKPLTTPSPLWGEGRGEGSGDVDAVFLPSSLSPADLADKLRANHSTAQHTWLTLQPPPGNGTSPDGRVADFVHRLVAAAASGADALFVHDPLEPAHGMFQGDGSPGELLVPWCTVARHLSGAEYLGPLQLPGGSETHVFQRDGRISVVLWNPQPGTEPLFIGQQARQLDVWGRTTTELKNGPDLRGHDLLIRVGPTPTFVVGGDPAVVRTQLGVQVGPPRLPSVASMPHTIMLHVPNCFGRRVTGQVTLHLPDRWRVVSAKVMPLDLPAGGEATLPFRVRLPFDGASGPQPLRLEFEIAAERPVRFTVYREVQVGLGDVELTGSARLDEQGNLLVRQQLTNRGTADVNFACQLLIPGRRSEHVTVRRQPPGTHEHVYTLPDGQELLGKTLRLRADELGGQRVLSQSLVPSR